jgi:uncharacterized protein YuzE
MKPNMTVKYDPQSDTLYIDTCPPYGEQESDEIARGVVARLNPTTGKVENIEVMFFRERFEAGLPFELPISLEMESVAGT